MVALLQEKLHPGSSFILPILAVSLVSLLLAGCLDVQANIALHSEGQWHGVTAIQIAPEFAKMMEEGNTGTTDTSVDTQGLDEFLEKARQSAGRDDVNVTFNEVKGEDGSLNYIIQGNGQEYNSLNEVFFEGEADISVETVNGQRQITIRAEIDTDEQAGSDSQQEMTPEDLAMMKSFGLGITYRISGGEIISSNASRVEGNTAIWDFPTLIEVTLTEAAEFSPASIALAEPPAGSGFSPSAFEALMEGLGEDLQTTNQTTPNTSSSDGGDSTGKAMTEPTTENADDSVNSTTESSNVTNETSQNAGESGDSSMNTAMEGSDTTAETPLAEEQNLPASGGVLPGGTGLAQLILAGLVLSGLGVSASVSLVNNRNK